MLHLPKKEIEFNLPTIIEVSDRESLWDGPFSVRETASTEQDFYTPPTM